MIERYLFVLLYKRNFASIGSFDLTCEISFLGNLGSHQGFYIRGVVQSSCGKINVIMTLGGMARHL